MEGNNGKTGLNRPANPVDSASYFGGAQNNRSPSSTTQTKTKTASGGEITTTSPIIPVQGGAQRTLSFATSSIERVSLSLIGNNNRPLNAQVELLQGADNIPQRMSVFSEDGTKYPVSLAIETPGSGNAIRLKNTSPMDFPLAAGVDAEINDQENTGIQNDSGINWIINTLSEVSTPSIVQGDSGVRTYPFGNNVESVQVLLKTDGAPMNARIELTQGPNDIKQIIEVYTEDGNRRPCYAVFETPGNLEYAVRVVNTSPMEFPLTAYVLEHSFDESSSGNGNGSINVVVGRQQQQQQSPFSNSKSTAVSF